VGRLDQIERFTWPLGLSNLKPCSTSRWSDLTV
jgi:hypothetical protein